MGRTLRDLLNHSFATCAEQTAIRELKPVEGSRTLSYQPVTYAELKSRRDQLAAGLAAQGLAKGQRVGILTDGGSEPLLIFLATDCIGVSAVPLCIQSPDEALAHSIAHSAVELLVVDRKGYERFGTIRERLDKTPRIALTEGEAEDAIPWGRDGGKQRGRARGRGAAGR